MESDDNYVNLVRLRYVIKHSRDPTDDIKIILDKGLDVNYSIPADCEVKEWRGCNALHFLFEEYIRMEEFFEPALELLLSYRAHASTFDITCQNHDGCTPIRVLFEYHNNGDRPTGFWAYINRLLSLQMESNNTANPCCNKGISHLHIACVSGNSKMVEFFLRAGADVNQAIQIFSYIFPNYSALHIAMRNRDKDLVRLLLKHGADLRCLTVDKITPMDLLCYDNLRDLTCRVHKLHFDNESLQNRFILDFVANYESIQNSIGLNQLHKLCIEKHDPNNFDELKKFLNSENVNSHVNFDSPIWPGYTGLHFSSQNDGHKVMLLLENGADLLTKDANGNTPLEFCCKTFKPVGIAYILQSQNNLKSIKFKSGKYLVDVISLFTTNNLREYLTTADVNDFIPFDSPLWAGYSMIHLAVQLSHQGGENLVKVCLENGADCTFQDATNMTALHLAFQLDKNKYVDDILPHIAGTANPVDNNNWSHLHIACMAKNVRVVEKLLLNGDNLNVTTNSPYFVDVTEFVEVEKTIAAGSTAYHIAATVNSKDLINLLVKSNADPNVCDAEGFTWVHRVFCQKRDNLYKFLWEHPDALKSNPIAPGGLSHLHIACYTGNLPAVESLLPFSSNVNEPINKELTNYVNQKCHGFHKRFDHVACRLCDKFLGDTQLHLAVRSDDFSEEMVNLLIKNGADVTIKNSKGHNPAYVCYTNQRLSQTASIQFKNVLRRLVLELKSKDKSSNAVTALHFACALKDISWMEELLGAGEDFNSHISADSQMWPGHSPLSLLIENQYFPQYPEYPLAYETVNLLLGYFLKKIENSNNKELHEFMKRRRISSLRNEDIVINKHGLTAFHVSCMGSDPHIVERFIRSGVDINAPTNFHSSSPDAGCTPLHLAVKYGSESVLEMLLMYGADIKIEDVRGRTPVHFAAQCYFDEVEIFVRLSNVEGDMKSTFGLTLMDSLFKNSNMSAKNCLYLLDLVHSNTIDLPTKSHYIRSWARQLSQPEFEKLIDCRPDFADVFTYVDPLSGRNIIHHIVSTKLYLEKQHYLYGNSVWINKFIANIKVILDKGCELDHQDKDGKTALHYGVQSRQEGVVEALLRVGADVNVTCSNGMTPYAFCFQEGQWCPRDEYSEKNDIIQLFADHIKYLEAAGLYLNEINKKFFRQNNESTVDPTYVEALGRMTEKEIYKTYCVRSLLTEKLVSNFHLLPRETRDHIIKYLDSKEWQREFPDWSPLFKLQRRRILKRQKLFEPVLENLWIILDPRLPEHCLKYIMACLGDQDWINLSRSINM